MTHLVRTLGILCLVLCTCHLVVADDGGGEITASDSASLVRRAIGAASHAVLERLLQRQPDLVNHIYEDGLSPLHVAVVQRNHVAVRLLLERRAEVNRRLQAAAFHDREMEGVTALHLAVRANSPDIVRLLAAAGSDLNSRDTQGRTPFTLARTLDFREVAYELRRHGAASFEDHLRAVLDGDVRAVEADLAAHPRYLARKDGNGQRPVDHAIRTGKAAIVSAFLKAGLGPGDLDRHGNTLLHIAAWEGQARIIQILLEAGFPVDPETNGLRPIHIAASRGQTECVLMLLSAGADAHIEVEGRDPAAIARARGFVGTATAIEDFIRRKTRH